MQLKSQDKIEEKLNKLLENVGDMSLKRRASEIVKELEIRDGDRIADLGCGDGFFIFLLINLPVKVSIFGLERDSWAITRAQENLGKNKKVKILQGSVTKMPFKANYFDKVILTEVLEHVDKDQLALKEIYRVLKPSGVMILTVPNLNYPFFWDPFNWVIQRLFNAHIKKDFWSGIWLGHLRLYKRYDLEELITNAGFKIEDVKMLTSWCLPFNHYLVNIIARMLYGHKLSIGCSNSINKFKVVKKPLIIKFCFWFVNTFDKLNDYFPAKEGLNIYVKIRK